jgi:primosomal protein N' (replication factor Y)
MAGYYVCPLGMVLSTMMPAAVKKGTGRRTRVHLDRAPHAVFERVRAETKLPPRLQAAIDQVAELAPDDFPIDPHALAARLEHRTLAAINRLIKLELLLPIEIDEIAEFGGVAVPRQGSLDLEQSARAAPPTPTAQQQHIIDGIGAPGTIDHFGVHLIRGVTGSGKTEVYLRLIERVLDAGKRALVLVPEISLTPQTAGRFIDRFGHRARNAVAVLHSGLTASQRHKQWQLTGRSGDDGARVVIGARSAVFAPIPDLGIIIVDEEHAGDYKQDQLPRYHGRDVAIKRAHLEDCPVILGSATPSLESWVNAGGSPPPGPSQSARPAAAARYRLWELTERVGGGALPRVEIVDLADERKLMRQMHPRRDPWQDVIGVRLEHALHETLAAGGQAILLLNRRGYSSYIACSDVKCGYRLGCTECDALMVHHRVLTAPGEPDSRVTPTRPIVRCHHCLAQVLMPPRCPVCDKPLIRLGFGTQRLEQELIEKFPELLDGGPGAAPPAPTSSPNDAAASHAFDPFAEAPSEPDLDDASDEIDEAAHRPEAPGPSLPSTFARIDGDTTRSGREWFDVLARFARGELRLLLGTQMIAKGLDFPNVRLVGVINADTSLALPDFRASERTFQLVSQVAGRAGRGVHGGRVIVQTMNPTAAAIRHAADHDYVGFAEGELRIRRRAALPPATRMARIVCRDRDYHKVSVAASRLATVLREEIIRRGMDPAVQIAGPQPAPIARIAGHHRQEIIITGRQRMAIQEVMAAARAQGLLKSDAHTAVDVDPMTLM